MTVATLIILIVAGLVILSVSWHYFMAKRSGRPRWNPLWMAFTLTAVALFYAIAGFIGYEVPRHNPFIERPAVWIGHVVWPQVALSSIMLLVSGPLWWLGLKRLLSSPTRRTSFEIATKEDANG